MRRTDEEFIKEVYERRKKHLKKIKQRNLVITLMLPVLLFGIFVGPAMLPASSADKSEPPLTTIINPPATNQSTTYPPGATVITVQPEGESGEYKLECRRVYDFIKEKKKDTTHSSSSIHDDENADSKRAEYGQKICAFNFTAWNQDFEHYSFSFYENALYDELSGETIILTEDEANLLKGLLKLN